MEIWPSPMREERIDLAKVPPPTYCIMMSEIVVQIALDDCSLQGHGGRPSRWSENRVHLVVAKE